MKRGDLMSVGLVIVVLLVCACIFVNGWTDAPNALAAVVTTRVLPPRAAVVLGALFNFLGVYLTGTAVASTTAGIVHIGTGKDALVTLGAALLSVVLWAVSAWRYGIPTSESHALIAGLMGAGVSNGGLGVFNWDAIRKVLMGLFISSAAGFALGYLAAKLLEAVCRRMSRRRTEGFFSTGQLASAALMAFAHGAQDGQKLMGVFCLTLTVGGICSRGSDGTMAIPAWVMLVCSLLMAFGTSVGGFRIIKSLGIDMVRLEKVPRLRSGNRRLREPDRVDVFRHPFEHDKHQGYGNARSRRHEGVSQDQLEHRPGHAPRVGPDNPRLPDPWLCLGRAFQARILTDFVPPPRRLTLVCL
jgi:PiT family inorganic phosphate transporter